MARLWMAFVLVVALAAVACEAIIQSRYEDVVNQAIEAYNSRRPGMPLFCLVDYTVLSFVVSVGHPSQGNRQGSRFLLPGHWGGSSVGRVFALHAWNPALRGWRQEGQKCRVNLSYVMSSRPAISSTHTKDKSVLSAVSWPETGREGILILFYAGWYSV